MWLTILIFCHPILPAPAYMIHFFNTSVVWETTCGLRIVLKAIKMNFQLLEIWSQLSFFFSSVKKQNKRKRTGRSDPYRRICATCIGFLWKPLRSISKLEAANCRVCVDWNRIINTVVDDNFRWTICQVSNRTTAAWYQTKIKSCYLYITTFYNC